MIKISTKIKKTFYYVSNIITGTITIIDASCNSIVKNIHVGKRPFKIAVMNNNEIYVACDRSSSIAVVDCRSSEVRKIYVSDTNNGIVEIDETNQRMFISDGSKVTIYDIPSGKLIASIIGFAAVSGLKLNNDKSKLYVMDRLLGALGIYDTVDYKLIQRFENIGINPGYFLISNDDKTVYISIEGDGVNLNSCNLLKINLEEKELKGLPLQKGSLIAGMSIEGSTLYTANKGLNRIELIDLKTYKAYDYILTSLPQPTRLLITDDHTKLLVTNRNPGGQGSVDIIDITSNCSLGRVLMEKYNSQPYDIVSVSLELSYADEVQTAITDLHKEENIREEADYMTNGNFSCCRFLCPAKISRNNLYYLPDCFCYKYLTLREFDQE